MRTNIDIADDLMTRAMRAGGFTTKRETVEAALKLLADRQRAYSRVLAMGGRVNWVGDLDAERRDVPSDAQKTSSVAKASKAARPQINRLARPTPVSA
jgi:antitoxin ParD1/3/4